MEECSFISVSETEFSDKVSYEIVNESLVIELGIDVKDARKNRIKSIFNKDGRKYIYIYYFGDNWVHTVIRKKMTTEDIERPICMDCGGACPPEDCGGVFGYAAMLESFNTPDHPERESYIEWLG